MMDRLMRRIWYSVCINDYDGEALWELEYGMNWIERVLEYGMNWNWANVLSVYIIHYVIWLWSFEVAI